VTSTRAATLRERPVPVGLLFPCMSYRIGSRKAKEGNPQTAGRRGVRGAGILTRHLGPLVRFYVYEICHEHATDDARQQRAR
jgi:hypothetical protein